MKNLSKISILRKVIKVDDSIELIEHHNFRNASFQNYGACVYMR